MTYGGSAARAVSAKLLRGVVDHHKAGEEDTSGSKPRRLAVDHAHYLLVHNNQKCNRAALNIFIALSFERSAICQLIMLLSMVTRMTNVN